MNITFHHGFDIKTGETFDWIITDDKIIYKDKAIRLDSLVRVAYSKPETYGTYTSNGSFSFYHGIGGSKHTVLTYVKEEQEYAQAVAVFLLNRLGEERFVDIEKEGYMSPKLKSQRRASSFGFYFACIAIIIVGIIVFATQYNGSNQSKNDNFKHDDVFNKDPNTWTDEEKEYVDDFFDWMKENN